MRSMVYGAWYGVISLSVQITRLGRLFQAPGACNYNLALGYQCAGKSEQAWPLVSQRWFSYRYNPAMSLNFVTIISAKQAPGATSAKACPRGRRFSERYFDEIALRSSRQLLRDPRAMELHRTGQACPQGEARHHNQGEARSSCHHRKGICALGRCNQRSDAHATPLRHC